VKHGVDGGASMAARHEIPSPTPRRQHAAKLLLHDPVLVLQLGQLVSCFVHSVS
jgi:hypothetical protein